MQEREEARQLPQVIRVNTQSSEQAREHADTLALASDLVAAKVAETREEAKYQAGLLSAKTQEVADRLVEQNTILSQDAAALLAAVTLQTTKLQETIVLLKEILDELKKGKK